MKVAFYAPLKSPDHPVPSGDRQLARSLLQALRAGKHETNVVSQFRSFDAKGDANRQKRLAELGDALAQRCLRRLQPVHARPDLWLTYHLYHKAPDWIGPRVSAALSVPYVVAEASVASKQRNGQWARGYAASVAAIKAAAAVIAFNPVDSEGIRALRGDARNDELIAPFIDLSPFLNGAPGNAPRALGAPLRLVTVAMMRQGAKLASYRLLAEALQRIAGRPWDLEIVGDGPARAEVEAAFSRIDPRRLRYSGAQPPQRVAEALRSADIFVWPAIDEAFGMAFIEAQACGLPVVAGRTGGVGVVLADGITGTLVPVGDAQAFALAVARLLDDAGLRRRMAQEAPGYVRAHHDLPIAAARINPLLDRVVIDHPGGRHRNE